VILSIKFTLSYLNTNLIKYDLWVTSAIVTFSLSWIYTRMHQVRISRSNSCLVIYALISFNNICHWKVPGLGQKRNAGFTNSVLAAINFKIASLGRYTAIPSSFPRFKSTVEVIFLNAVEYRLRLPLDVRHCFKTSPLQFHIQFGKQSEITEG
jgi:hypothetical protein